MPMAASPAVAKSRRRPMRSWTSGKPVDFTKKGVQLFRRRLAPESSTASRRRVGRLWGAEDRADQVKSDFTQPVPGFDGCFHRSAAGGYLKVSPFDLHRDGPTARIRSLAPSPDLVGHRDHARFDPSRIGKVLGEGRLRSRGLSLAVRLDRPIVLTSCMRVVPDP